MSHLVCVQEMLTTLFRSKAFYVFVLVTAFISCRVWPHKAVILMKLSKWIKSLTCAENAGAERMLSAETQHQISQSFPLYIKLF